MRRERVARRRRCRARGRGALAWDAPGRGARCSSGRASRPALMDAWEGAETVWLVDAVSSGAQAGAVHRVDASEEELPARLFRASTHHFGLAEAVELARALGRLPRARDRLRDRGRELRRRRGADSGRGGRGPSGRGFDSEGGRRVHEQALMNDLMRKIEAEVRSEGGRQRHPHPRATRCALPLHRGSLPRALRRRVARHSRGRRGGRGRARR